LVVFWEPEEKETEGVVTICGSIFEIANSVFDCADRCAVPQQRKDAVATLRRVFVKKWGVISGKSEGCGSDTNYTKKSSTIIIRGTPQKITGLPCAKKQREWSAG
jgi:hypothetical protein